MTLHSAHIVSHGTNPPYKYGIAVVATNWLVQHAVAHLVGTVLGEGIVSVHSKALSVDPESTVLLIWLPEGDDAVPLLPGGMVLGLGDARGTSLMPWLPQWQVDEMATATAIAAFYAECMAGKPTLMQLSGPHKAIPYLTRRQTSVLHALANGLSNADIAAQLHMSENTVRIHISAILKGMKVSNRTQAALQANRLGMIASDTLLQ